jgi:hypothetical protein
VDCDYSDFDRNDTDSVNSNGSSTNSTSSTIGSIPTILDNEITAEELEMLITTDRNKHDPNAKHQVAKSTRKEESILRRNRYRSLFNRIMKTDIRRDYGSMYVNVMNGGDARMIRKFFKRFAVPFVHAEDYLPKYLGGSLVIADGLEQVINLYCTRLDKTPDAIFTMKNCQIIRKYGQIGSSVVMTLLFRASLVMPDNTISANSTSTVLSIKITPIELVVTTTFNLDDQHRILDITVYA